MKSARAKKPPRVKALPYESATSGKRAILEMGKTLEAIGASGFGCYEEFDKAEVIAQFKWRDMPVTIRASAKGYAAIWLRRHPYSNSMRLTRTRLRTTGAREGQDRRLLDAARLDQRSGHCDRDWHVVL